MLFDFVLKPENEHFYEYEDKREKALAKTNRCN